MTYSQEQFYTAALCEPSLVYDNYQVKLNVLGYGKSGFYKLFGEFKDALNGLAL